MCNRSQVQKFTVQGYKKAKRADENIGPYNPQIEMPQTSEP